jgi:type I restriction enzyme S subunit
MRAGWQIKTLAEVCQIKPPKAEARRNLAETDLVSFVPMENLGIDQKTFLPTQTRPLAEVAGSYTYFADGDVLLAKITPCFENGKLGIATDLINGIGFGSSEYIVFRPDNSVNKEWLYYFLSRDAFRVEGAARMSGAVGHKRVAKEFIETCSIPVPPLPEQHRIITILDEAFDGIATAKANAENNLQNARALFESHLQSVFTARGEGWVEKHLKDVCEKITDGTHQTPTYFDDGIVFLSSRNVTSGKINWDRIKYIDTKQHLEMHKRVAPRRDDILLAKNGTTGVAAIVDRDTTFDIYVSLALLRSLPVIRPQLLLYFINSPIAKSQFNKRLKGVGVPNLHLEEIREVRISFPQNLLEQDRLIEGLDSLSTETQRLESIYKQKVAALDGLKKSLLHQAFTGQLTACSVDEAMV